MRVVMGKIRALRHDLSNLVGMMSSGQLALDDARMTFLTSATDAGEKMRREGGTESGGDCGDAVEEVEADGLKTEHSFLTLASKNWRKDEASEAGEDELGRVGGNLRERRLSRADHNLRGC